MLTTGAGASVPGSLLVSAANCVRAAAAAGAEQAGLGNADGVSAGKIAGGEADLAAQLLGAVRGCLRLLLPASTGGAGAGANSASGVSGGLQTEPLQGCLQLVLGGQAAAAVAAGPWSLMGRGGAAAAAKAAAAVSEMSRSAQQLLAAVLFNEAHVGPLAEVMAAAAHGGGGAGADQDAAAAVTGLPWLLRTFCRAAARMRRLLAADAAAAATAAGGSTERRRQQPGAGGGDKGGADDGTASGGGGVSQKALAAAEFNCMIVLAYMSLQPPSWESAVEGDGAGGRPAKKRKMAGPGQPEGTLKAAGCSSASAGPAAAMAIAQRRLALAGLLAAGRAAGAYQPTRDVSGAHAAALATIADRLLAAEAAAQAEVGAGPARKAPRLAGTAPAVEEPSHGLGSLSTSLALCALLDLDHRVLAPHLERVWELLWLTAAAASGPAAPAAAVGSAAAAAVLHRSVRAFAELRQLTALLSSLGAAMRALCRNAPEGGGGGGSGKVRTSSTEQVAVPAERLAGVAAALLVRPEVLAALRQAVSAAPSDNGDSGAAADNGGGDWGRYCTARLAALLRLYGCVVHTNAVCAGLHPEVPQLAEQGISASRGLQDHQEQEEGHGQEGGYFAAVAAVHTPGAGSSADVADGDGGDGAAAPLRQARKALKRAGCSHYGLGLLPALAQLSLPAGLAGVAEMAGTSGAAALAEADAVEPAAHLPVDWPSLELARAVHRCLCQRVQTLHERHLRTRNTCPLYGRTHGGRAHAPRPVTDDAADGAGAGAGAGGAGGIEAPPAAPDEETATAKGAEEERELRTLANLLLSPFSPAAAAAAELVPGGTVRSRAAASGSGGDTAASVAAVAWSDTLALMGCIGPAADPRALSEVLQLALRAVCSGAGGRPSGSDAARGGLLPRLQPAATTGLRLPEFQGLEGVRQALPCAWAAEVAGALHGLAAAAQQLVQQSGGDDRDDGTEPPAKKAKRKSGAAAGTQALGSGPAAAAALVRLQALSAAASPGAAADRSSEASEAGSAVEGVPPPKVLRRHLQGQTAALGQGQSRGLHGGSIEPRVAASPAGVPGAAGTQGSAAAQLCALLELLSDSLHVELLTRKARRAMLRQAIAACAALTDSLLTLCDPAPAAGEDELQRHRARRELLLAAAAGLRAWERLQAGLGAAGSGSAGGGVTEDPWVGWLLQAASFLVRQAAACDAIAAAATSQRAATVPVALAPELVVLCGRLLEALLRPSSPAEDAGKGLDMDAAQEAAAERLSFGRELLKGAEEGLSSSGGDAGHGDSGAGHSRGKPQVAAGTMLAEVMVAAEAALACRLGLAAVATAALLVGEPLAERGGKAREQAVSAGGAGGGGAGAAAVPRELKRLAKRATALLEAAEGPPTAAGAPAGAALSHHRLRAALCLAAVQGLVLRMSAACGTAAVAQPANPAAGAAAGSGRVPAMPLDSGALPELLQRAAGWVVAERQQQPPAASGGDHLAADVAAEPLEHCLALMGGVATSGMWGVLLADLHPAGVGCRSRRLLLECFRDTLARSNRGQLAGLLRSLLAQLTYGSLTGLGAPRGALLPPLHCLLVCLECLSGPRVAKLLAAQGPALTAALTEVLGALSVRTSVEAAGGPAVAAPGLGGGATTSQDDAASRAAVEAAACAALRCLQSVLGREVTFRLPSPTVTAVLAAAAALASCPLLQPPLPSPGAAPAAESVVRGPLFFLHCACSGLLAALVRHHAATAAHCAALLVEACRSLLRRLAAWAAQMRHAQRQLQLQPTPDGGATAADIGAAVDGLTRCATALARVQHHGADAGAVGEVPPVDARAPQTDQHHGAKPALGGGAAAAGLGAGLSSATLLPAAAHQALRLGAYSLLGCLGPQQLQHLHMALGTGAAAGEAVGAGLADPGGAARRAALAQLRKEYESSYKYTGKV
ncbi:hypothetical protein GPECTOR_6g823 [Gonium pectorale]|uniref:Nucleolar 27S pre-rRNA processing Urb2/Npa2 C-terminal domain-containing protein n=1 Tax=Gonium pectorale TaxID=33097 RepID=A0A150GVQ7_GONPE|nr:hypothetical protein GPECTOR_6g823 [Gonium pectorale]|eukprot:KXZ53905.1 hypothetical protein GPECTOR_6g823 [Gonium pectorale]